MKGSFSLDLLLGLIVLTFLLQPLIPSWKTFQQAVKTSTCEYLKDVLRSESTLSSDLNVTFIPELFSPGSVEIRGNIIYVMGEKCP